MIEITLEQLAEEIGFNHIGKLNRKALVFREEVRDMCNANRCSAWNTRWTCPPACGSLETIRKRASRYQAGILVQSTEKLSDPFDFVAMKDLETIHKKRFDSFIRQARQTAGDILPMGSGTCTLCRRCTWPDRPCRHPDRACPSMEAYGLLITDVLEQSGMKYSYGEGTMTYTSCILFHPEMENR
jgi:predicted metal-binding protein